jgi:predicted ATPase
VTRLVVLSGCSSGGKSTLLEELARRGHATVPEPGRRVVREEMASGGAALPWSNTRAFVDRIVAVAMADYEAATGNAGWTFFDRGLIDALSALGDLNGTGFPREMLADYPHHRRVFLAPPWPEIYVMDGERQHGLAQAEREYERLLAQYPALGYEVTLLPKISVAERADFVERILAEP